ncbi:hypothetical protein [Phyllobacterium zundukense]|uniref:Lipoprotein n=1 Tax=Phyllobacterium zundukense TaxID=1867719 RepID=A0A2N9VS09_9HYPH|nr:hypothetical protein [Phyllobacterium zundukense]ATU92703.1 hypothetical protein BLM14_14495 [Phyllobacterium zundukense]PIO42277.1 hypothetical protein B5P45_24950 [Phyllobacterium zundukense]
MRLVLPLVALSLILVAGCTTQPKTTTATGPLPAKDTYYVPPPKSLTTRAAPEVAAKDAAAKTAAKPAAAQ